jgi:hypothetical protein
LSSIFYEWGHPVLTNSGIQGTLYLFLDPVRAGLVGAPDKWPWSSTAAHISGHGDGLVKPELLLAMVKEDWKSFLVKTL